jgi:ribonuclease VapC
VQNTMTDDIVIFDASALIALFLEELGHEILSNVAARAIMSSVNVAEVAKFLVERRGMLREEIIGTIEALIAVIMPFEAQDAYLNAELITKTKAFGLSLGDRACIALGIKTGYPVYTFDKDWSKIDSGCKIIQIR